MQIDATGASSGGYKKEGSVILINIEDDEQEREGERERSRQAERESIKNFSYFPAF